MIDISPKKENRTYLLDKSDIKNQNQQVAAPNFSAQFIKTLGDNSYPFIEKKNIFDIVSEISAKVAPIRPENKWLLAWNALIMFIILYYLFEIGLIWGYGKVVWDDELRLFYAFNYLFILILILDCFLNNIKCYYSHGLLVTHPRLIVKRYLTARFYVDILAILSISIPFFSGIYQLNWIKALFLLKLYSLYQIDKQFIRVTELKISYHTFYLLSRLVLLLILGSHFLGIWFYMIDYWVYQNNYYGPNTPNICWIYNAEAYSQLVILQPWWIQYIYTMYFSIGTMTTIAYGDITPLNPIQTLYITISLVPYTLGFAYILSQILRILMQAQASKFEHSNNLLIVSNLMKNNHIKQKTQVKVKSYFQKVWKEEIYRNRDVEIELIQKLPHRIRNELFSEMYKSFFIASGLFHYGSNFTVESDFIVALANEILQERLIEDHIIYKEGEEYDPENSNNHRFYFIKQIRKRKPKPSIQIGVMDLPIQVFSEGYIGKQGFFTGQNRDHWARVIESVVVYQLSRKVLEQNIHLTTEVQAQNLFFLNERVSNQKCFICRRPGHNFRSCQFVTYQVNKVGLVKYYKQQLEKEIKKVDQQEIKRKRKSFNTLLIHKIIKSLNFRVRKSYYLVQNNKYYKELLRSKKIKDIQNRKSEGAANNYQTLQKGSLISSKLENIQPKVVQLNFISPLSKQNTGNRKDLSIGIKNSHLHQRKYSSSSESSCSSSDSQTEFSNLNLQNYLRQTELYIKHLTHNDHQEESWKGQQLEIDSLKIFQIYLPHYNVDATISDYNRSVEKQNEREKKRRMREMGEKNMKSQGETDQRFLLNASQQQQKDFFKNESFKQSYYI